MTCTRGLIHSLRDQLLAHSTVLGQPGQESPWRSLDGLPEAFEEAGSVDSVTSHVVGLVLKNLLTTNLFCTQPEWFSSKPLF
uniref:Uncharacterized protein n=1 Tax=Lepeophtheirus salmonis TaxID=72036 RepID=A0A0K2VB19_LEPSM